jgi:hypothetical protein
MSKYRKIISTAITVYVLYLIVMFFLTRNSVNIPYILNILLSSMLVVTFTSIVVRNGRKYIKENHPEYWSILTNNKYGFENSWSTLKWKKVLELDEKDQKLSSYTSLRRSYIVSAVIFYIISSMI